MSGTNKASSSFCIAEILILDGSTHRWNPSGGSQEPSIHLGVPHHRVGSRLFVLQWIFSALEFSLDNNGRREGERERASERLSVL